MSQLTPISVVETALPNLCQNDIRKEITETPQMENVVLLFLLNLVQEAIDPPLPPNTLGLFMLRLFKSQPDEVMNLSNC
jgi:hypothetical protein